MIRLLGSVMLASLLATMASPHAQAQYRPVYPNPYYNSGYGYGSNYGFGNTLAGYADLNRSTADVMQSNEQSRMIREKTQQERINTKKQAFDEMMYEKANTPTYGETLSKDKAQLLTRLMNYPIPSEITDGKTLNAMLPNIQAISTYGTPGQPISLPQQMVSMLNVTGGSGGGGSGGGSVGLLRDGGRVEWPLALMGPQQEKLDKLLPQAFDATIGGKLTPKLMREIRTEMKTMRSTMREQLAREEIEGTSYMRAIEFYNSLESSVNALERPDARKQLNGTYSARGRNVQELVDYMTNNGLRFAAASPGSENAYFVVHDAFVRYSRTVESSLGSQASRAPDMQKGFEKR